MPTTVPPTDSSSISSGAESAVDGRPARYLITDGTVPVRVGRSGPIELWRLDLTAQPSVP